MSLLDKNNNDLTKLSDGNHVYGHPMISLNNFRLPFVDECQIKANEIIISIPLSKFCFDTFTNLLNTYVKIYVSKQLSDEKTLWTETFKFKMVDSYRVYKPCDHGYHIMVFTKNC